MLPSACLYRWAGLGKEAVSGSKSAFLQTIQGSGKSSPWHRDGTAQYGPLFFQGTSRSLYGQAGREGREQVASSRDVLQMQLAHPETLPLAYSTRLCPVRRYKEGSLSLSQCLVPSRLTRQSRSPIFSLAVSLPVLGMGSCCGQGG